MINLFWRCQATFLTFLRGVALPGEKPLLTVTPLMMFFATLGGYAVSILCFQIFWYLGFYLLLPLAFILGQAAVWTLYMIEHHAIHGAIAPKPWLNHLVAEVSSVVSLTIEPEKYKRSHNSRHHVPKILATDGDPDRRFLESWGFVGGKSLDYYYRQLFLTLINPFYYLKSFAKRLHMNLVSAPVVHRVYVVIWWSAIAILTLQFNLWGAFLGYVSVIIVGYGMSALLQTLCEHRWGYNGTDYAYKTFPRLLPIDTYPGMVLIYLYWRSAVLSTDLCQHQIHHLKPRNFNWPMVAYSSEAQTDVTSAVWGIKAHFDAAFTSLSQS
jgi:fatty acid desaturase